MKLHPNLSGLFSKLPNLKIEASKPMIKFEKKLLLTQDVNNS